MPSESDEFVPVKSTTNGALPAVGLADITASGGLFEGVFPPPLSPFPPLPPPSLPPFPGSVDSIFITLSDPGGLGSYPIFPEESIACMPYQNVPTGGLSVAEPECFEP